MLKYILPLLITIQASAAPAVREAFDLISNSATWPKITESDPVRSFVFTEDEVNAFIRQWVREEAGKTKPAGVMIKSASIRLTAEHMIEIDAVASFSPEAVRSLGAEDDSAFIKTIKRYLTMENSIRLECLVSSAKGNIFIRVLKAKVKGILLPDSFVQKIVRLAGASQRPPMDLTRLFPLPNGIQKIEILPQKLGLQIKVPDAAREVKRKE